MMRHLFALFWVLIAHSPHLAAEDAIRLDLKVEPRFQSYAELLTQPGYGAVLLENNDLSPSASSKIKIGEQGRSAEIRNATLRFVDRKDGIFHYEAAYLLGLGDVKISFAVAVDTSALAQGRVTVVASPPLAKFFPAELTDRIRYKIQLVANNSAQKKIIEYLDRFSRDGNLIEAILVDAYNRSGGPVAGTRDVGDAVPLSEQWLLILTLVIWLLVLPAWLLVHRLRRRRSEPA